MNMYHYNIRVLQDGKNINCYEVIEALTKDLEGIDCFYMGNVIKYLWRYRYKNEPLEDLDKAIAYLENLRNSTKIRGEYDA